MKSYHLMNVLGLLGGCLSLAGAEPMGTAFTYQGRLADDGKPASGSYEFLFTVYDAPTEGTLVAGPITNSAVTVINGLFHATLDFGEGVFTGEGRWLEIGVRTNGSLVDFPPLVPRQSLTPTPYALHAGVAREAGVAGEALHVGANTVNGESVMDGTLVAADLAPEQVVKSLNTLRDVVELAEGENISVVTAPGRITLFTPTDWHVSGNAGTSPNGNFLGTTDDQPLEMKVNNLRALRLEPAAGAPNFIGGSLLNSVALGTGGAFIGGGRANRIASASEAATVAGGDGNDIGILAPYSAIGGGQSNNIVSSHATIAGGLANMVTADFGTIAGGGPVDPANPLLGNRVFDHYGSVGGGGNNRAGTDDRNPTNSTYATVGGGGSNWATGQGATVSGGFVNEASGVAATVPGGDSNTADGDYSFAAGHRARANHPGAFVWADSIGQDLSSTADNQLVARATGGFRLWVDTNATGLRLFPVTNDFWGATLNHLAGYGGNHTVPGTVGVTISGGGTADEVNRVTGHFGSIAGGRGNRIENEQWGVRCATIAGGYDNKVEAAYSTIGGGEGNFASGSAVFQDPLGLIDLVGWSTIGGGAYNQALAYYATVGGGDRNTASGSGAIVPGGGLNTASGDFSFAAGYRARANHRGSFVWADATNADFLSTADNEVSFRCSGGVRFTSGVFGPDQTVWWTPGSGSWSFNSDRTGKENLRPVNTAALLERVSHLPLHEWNYIGYEQRHVGPMAQDFHEAFPWSGDARTLNSADLDGVALAAIQGLNEKVERGNRKAENRMERLEVRSEEWEARSQKLAEQNAALEKRVAELTALVRSLADQVNGGAR